MIRDPKAVLFVCLQYSIILSGCTREEAASFRADVQVDELEIMLGFHADHLTCTFLATDFELRCRANMLTAIFAGTFQTGSGLGKFCESTLYRVSTFANNSCPSSRRGVGDQRASWRDPRAAALPEATALWAVRAGRSVRNLSPRPRVA
jgi:hypothetical protein